MNCKICGKHTTGMIVVFGKGGFPYCGSEECKRRAIECEHDYTGDPTVSASGGTCVKCGHFEQCG